MHFTYMPLLQLDHACVFVSESVCLCVYNYFRGSSKLRRDLVHQLLFSTMFSLSPACSNGNATLKYIINTPTYTVNTYSTLKCWYATFIKVLSVHLLVTQFSHNAYFVFNSSIWPTFVFLCVLKIKLYIRPVSWLKYLQLILINHVIDNG